MYIGEFIVMDLILTSHNANAYAHKNVMRSRGVYFLAKTFDPKCYGLANSK